MDNSITFKIILFSILIMGSGFFSGMEIALSSLSAVDIQRIREMGGYRDRLMTLWVQHPGRVLTGILIGNNLVNIGAATLASAISLILARMSGLAEATALALSTGLVTFLVLILGEITPKTFAKQNPTLSVKIVSFPLVWFLRIFSIPSLIFTKIASVIIHILGGQAGLDLSGVTEEDIRDMIRMGQIEGVIDEHEHSIIHHAFDFGHTPVAKIMTPRVDIKAIAYDATLQELMTLMEATKFSRIPIYEDDINNIFGIAYIKHALKFWHRGYFEMKVMECYVIPLQVPETRKIGELLLEFQHSNHQMAIVFDEYGQTSGVVTLEDILEELVGEIGDELEAQETGLEHLFGRAFKINGQMEINQVNKVLGTRLPSADFNTVAGWANWIFGRIPGINETTISPEGIRVRILAKDQNKILAVQLNFPTDEPYQNFKLYKSKRKTITPRIKE